jgi:peptidyl-dipeptidase A
MMGQLFASQVHHAICREVLHGANLQTALYVGNKTVGEFMKKKVFDPGRRKPWNALTEYATGKPLNAGKRSRKTSKGSEPANGLRFVCHNPMR